MNEDRSESAVVFIHDGARAFLRQRIAGYCRRDLGTQRRLALSSSRQSKRRRTLYLWARSAVRLQTSCLLAAVVEANDKR